MSFAEPIWLYAAIPILLVCLWLTLMGSLARKRLIVRFIAPAMATELLASLSRFRRGVKVACIFIALACVLTALARPQWGYRWTETKARGIDVLIALDVSRSMLAEDMRPSRLERAKLAILDLLDALESDRIGLIAFAGSAFLQCPLTLDHEAFRLTLESVNPEIIPRGGSDISAAINEANAAFDSASNHRILILITDGEDHAGAGLSRAREVAKDGVRIYTVGVGTTKGALIPMRHTNGQRGYVRDKAGTPVNSRLEAETLEAIAQTTGGFYRNLVQNPNALQEIYQNMLDTVPAQEREANLEQTGIERFQFFLAIACALLLFEPLVGVRRRTIRMRGAATVLFLLMLLSGMPSGWADIPPAVKEAENAFARGEYGEAVTHYQQALEAAPEDTRLRYNLGTALYKANNLLEADSAFEKVLETGTLPLQAKAFYNRGNIRYFQGEEKLQQSPKQTVSFWEDALDQYDSALEIDPADSFARENREKVANMLEALKEELRRQEEQKQQEHNQNQQNQKQEQQSSQDQESDKQQQEQQQSGQQQQQDQGGAEQSEGQNQPQDGKGGEQSDTRSGEQSGEQSNQDGQRPPPESPENTDSKNVDGNDGEPKQDKPADATKDQNSAGEQQSPGTEAQPPRGTEPDQQRNPQKQAPANAGDQLGENADSQDSLSGISDEVQEQEPLSPENKGTGEQQEDEEDKPASETTSGKADRTEADGNETPAGDERVIPGYMTYEEARMLLQSLRKDERKLPFMGRGQQRAEQQAQTEKDW